MIQEQNQRESQAPQASNQIQQEIGRNSGQNIGQLDNGQALNFQNVQNIFFQQSGTSSSAIHPSQLKKELPHFLPYLANRREQESQLGEAFLKFIKQDSPGHFVCIIHGDESQCHYNFLERMRKFSLPQWLELEPHQPIIPKYHLEWPTKFKNSQSLLKQLYKNLAHSLLGNDIYCSEKINSILSKYTHPVIIHTHLLTEDLDKQGFGSIDKLLEFCQQLHQEIIKQKLIIYIFIQYKIKRNKSKKTFWMNFLFGFGRSFFKQYRYQQINKKVRQYLQNLTNSDLKDFQPLLVTVLSELEGINRGEVENWVRSEHTKQLVGEDMIEPLIQKVAKMFASWEDQELSDTIPMSDLAEKLVELLKSLTAV
ncbi:hypothetical protein [Anabaena subtropica]|uniref:Inactive STAND domain-containing protein n=1 Tax=Anabaena subtropica FACHB-260 TaxID=2692884 RepID=A0ABR8CUN9_9NOST|nr:hypothetical protein [Anabaena subtropica]MBD2346205.1 hypothetical protein [Anabaena subtropica FACHB-260]